MKQMDSFTIWDKDIEEVTASGIRYPGGFIDFAECAARCQRETGGDGRCVGRAALPLESAPEKTLEAPVSILFFTDRLPTRLGFQGQGMLEALLNKQTPPEARLKALTDKIQAYGYSVENAP